MKNRTKYIFTRLICILSVFVVIFGSLTFSVSAEGEFEISEYGEKMSLLIDSGIIKEDSNMQMTMTRGEFAYLMTKVLGFYDMETEKCNTVFKDVTERTPYSKSIDTIYNMGFIKGNGTGFYYPDEKIVINDAIAIMIRALGYDIYAGTDFMALAYQLGVLDGVSFRNGSVATRGQIYMVLVNTLEIPLMETDYGEADLSSYRQNENATILNRYLGIEKTEGVLTATSLCVADDYGEVEEGFVRIDGVSYKCGKNMENYVGQMAEIYYTENRQTKKRNLITFVPYTSKSVVLKAENIESFDVSSMSYVYVGQKKDVRYKLTDDRTVVVYNGSIIRNDISRYMLPETGSIKLVDNNSDGYYEYVFIEEYFSIVAEKYSPEKNVLYGRDDLAFHKEFNEIDFDNYEKIVLRDDGNRVLNPDDIAKNNVVTIRKSVDGTIVFLLVSSSCVTGEITEIIRDSDRTGVIINGIKYYLAKDCRINPQYLVTSKSSVFYLDYFGDIVYSENGSSNLHTGYLTDCRADDFKEVYQLRIKDDSSQTRVYRIKDNVRMSYCDGFGEVVKTVGSKKLYEELEGKRCVVLFAYEEISGDSSSETEYVLKEIKLPYSVAQENELENVKNYPLLKMDYLISDWPGTEGQSSYNAEFNTEYYGMDFWTVFDRNGPVFYVPELSDANVNPDEILVSKISNIEDDKTFAVYPAGSGKVNSFDVYTIGGHKLRNNLLVIYSQTADSSSIPFEGAASVVAGIRQIYNTETGEAINRLTIIGATGAVKEYYVDDAQMLEVDYFGSCKWRGTLPEISDGKKRLSVGDIIKYSVNEATGEITGYVLIYDSENNKLAYSTSAKAVFTAYPVSVYETDANVFSYIRDNGRKEMNAMSGRIVVIDKENKKYKIGSASDIEKDDIAFLTGRWGFIQLITVYKEFE